MVGKSFVRTIRVVSVGALGGMTLGACGYDFGKFSSSGAGTEPDSAAVGDDARAGDGSLQSEASMPAEASADAPLEASEVDASDASEASVTDYTVGGTITGLAGHGLRLANAGSTLTVAGGATTFTFPAQPNGSAYAVTVTTQPSMPSQTCAVTAGSGTIAGANVTGVQVDCTPTCAPGCTNGQPCIDGTDCGSGSCQGGSCRPPACAPHCNDGNACGANGDCGSSSCTGGKCQPPACSPTCSDGSKCGAAADCASQVCNAGKCQPPACSPNCPTGSPCGANGDCRSGTCRGNHTCR